MSVNVLNLKDPESFHRDFENDIRSTSSSNNYYYKLASRVAFISLPFIAMYQPIGKALAIVTSGSRSFSCSVTLFHNIQEGNVQQACKSLFDSGMAISSVAGTIFLNPLGMVITTVHDISINVCDLYQATIEGDYQKAVKSTIRVSNNSLHLLTMVYGGLGLQIGAKVLQIVLTAYSSKEEFQKGNYLEAGAHLVMVSIKVHQLRLLNEKYQLQSFISILEKYAPDPMINAAIEGDINAVNVMVENGMSINNLCDGRSPLRAALSYDKIEMAKFLISKDHIIQKTAPGELVPSLFLAIYYCGKNPKNIEVVKLILDKGIDIHKKAHANIHVYDPVKVNSQCRKMTPFQYATSCLKYDEIFKDVVALLIDHGALPQ